MILLQYCVFISFPDVHIRLRSSSKTDVITASNTLSVRECETYYTATNQPTNQRQQARVQDLLCLFRNDKQLITRKPSCRWQTRATRCNVIVAPLAEERLAILTKSIHRWKVHLVRAQYIYALRALYILWYGSVSIRLAVVAFQMYEIARNNDKSWPYVKVKVQISQSHPRSSILVSMESPCMTSN